MHGVSNNKRFEQTPKTIKHMRVTHICCGHDWCFKLCIFRHFSYNAMDEKISNFLGRRIDVWFLEV